MFFPRMGAVSLVTIFKELFTVRMVYMFISLQQISPYDGNITPSINCHVLPLVTPGMVKLLSIQYLEPVLIISLGASVFLAECCPTSPANSGEPLVPILRGEQSHFCLQFLLR